jgi:hypothetical protein
MPESKELAQFEAKIIQRFKSEGLAKENIADCMSAFKKT